MTHNGVRHEQPNDRDGLALHKRAMANGFGNAMGTATEIALLPAIFGVLGWAIDSWLGTEPVFLVALLVFAFAGMLVRTWLGYDKEMRAQEQGLYTRIGRRGREERAA